MKFFKTKRDQWLNPALVKYFYNSGKKAYAVFGHVYRSDGVLYDSDQMLIGEFDSADEAKKYIDGLVTKINKETATFDVGIGYSPAATVYTS